MTHVLNPAVSRLATTPLHALVGGVVVLEVTGRTSGRLYRVPVNARPSGDGLLVRTRARRTWWRNLEANPEVGLWRGGHRSTALATAGGGRDGGVVVTLRPSGAFRP